MKPSQEQIKKDIASFNKRKNSRPSQQQINKDIASFNSSKSTPQIKTPKPKEPKKIRGGFLGEIFTGNTQRFGKTLGDALYAPIAAKKYEKSEQEKIDFETRALKKLKTATPEAQKRIMKALKMNRTGREDSKLETFTGDVINKTKKEIAGEAIGAGVEALSGGLFSAGRGAAVNTATRLQKAGTLAKKAAQFGGATGISEGLQQNQNAAGVLGTGALYAGAGAVGGKIIGGIGNKVAKTIGRNTSLFPKLTKNVLTDDASKIVDPIKNLDPKKYAERASKPGSTERSLFGESKLLPNRKEREISESISNVVKKDKSLDANRDLIGKEKVRLGQDNNKLVTDNNGIFNKNQLIKKLNMGKDELELVFAGDNLAENVYEKVTQVFMRNVDTKNLSGLLKARQAFDKLPAVKKLLNNDKLGENARKDIVEAVRRKANEFIKDGLPKEAGERFSSNLKNLSNMFSAEKTIGETLAAQRGTTAGDRFLDTRTGKLIKTGAYVLGSAGIIQIVANAIRGKR